MKRLWLKWEWVARDASPISLVGVVTFRLSHVVSTKGLKGQKGTHSPGGIGLCSQSSAIYALSSPSDVAVDTWINHVKSSHKAKNTQFCTSSGDRLQ